MLMAKSRDGNVNDNLYFDWRGFDVHITMLEDVNYIAGFTVDYYVFRKVFC